MSENREKDARFALLARLIDHAPLFPPASLPLPAAVEEDRSARESSWSFMLGRFVCPASRLGELPEVGRGVSAVLDVELPPDERVEAVEARLDAAPAAKTEAYETYLELPVDESLDERLDEVAARGARAKVRCGGDVAPGVEALARFLRGCRERSVPFKATAGLHHAVRGGAEHGLLNLLAATVFEDEEGALAEEEPDAFRLDGEMFGWRGRLAGPDELRRARKERLRAIGSCSFFEPVEELEALGVMPP